MKPSSVNRITSIVGDMIRIYPVLRDVITEAQDKDDPKKYIAFRCGSIRGRWFAENYLSRRRQAGLKNALIDISKTLLKESEEAKAAAHLEINISKEIASVMGITGNKNFLRLEDLLPSVLRELAEKAYSSDISLISLANRLESEVGKTHEMQLRVAEGQPAKKPSKSESLAQQAKAAEALINSILEGLDEKLAHTLRVKIAKSDNKLQTLEQELSRIAY